MLPDFKVHVMTEAESAEIQGLLFSSGRINWASGGVRVVPERRNLLFRDGVLTWFDDHGEGFRTCTVPEKTFQEVLDLCAQAGRGDQ